MLLEQDFIARMSKNCQGNWMRLEVTLVCKDKRQKQPLQKPIQRHNYIKLWVWTGKEENLFMAMTISLVRLGIG